jgi:hypothetical protein
MKWRMLNVFKRLRWHHITNGTYKYRPAWILTLLFHQLYWYYITIPDTTFVTLFIYRLIQSSIEYSPIHESFVSVGGNTSLFTDDEGETSEENNSDENNRYDPGLKFESSFYQNTWELFHVPFCIHILFRSYFRRVKNDFFINMALLNILQATWHFLFSPAIFECWQRSGKWWFREKQVYIP